MKKGLQNLTKSNEKFEKLLLLDSISPQDLVGFTEQEIKDFMQLLNDKINSLSGEEQDRFFDRIIGFVTEENRHNRWEYHQAKITRTISILMKEEGRLPTQMEIAEKSGLSRQTVNKHLKEIGKTPYLKEYIETFRFMGPKVLARVYAFAVNGDVKAARLFLQATGYLQGTNNPSTGIETQNNYIQINNTIINQSKLKELPLDKLTQIEEILNKVLN
jgi:hypothetical protein